MRSDVEAAKLESVRAVLWAMVRILDCKERLSLAAKYELRTLSQTGLQLTDEYFESLEER